MDEAGVMMARAAQTLDALRGDLDRVAVPTWRSGSGDAFRWSLAGCRSGLAEAADVVSECRRLAALFADEADRVLRGALVGTARWDDLQSDSR